MLFYYANHAQCTVCLLNIFLFYKILFNFNIVFRIRFFQFIFRIVRDCLNLSKLSSSLVVVDYLAVK